jgi:hypothetical protein
MSTSLPSRDEAAVATSPAEKTLLDAAFAVSAQRGYCATRLEDVAEVRRNLPATTRGEP